MSATDLPTPGAAGLLLAALLLALAGSSGCGPAPAADGEHPAPDAVVDVPPSVSVSVADDPQEPPRQPQLSGVLPGDFPPDLPVHLPASVIDFGPGWVQLLSPAPAGQIRAGLRSRLEAAGWRATAAEGGLALRKGDRTARLTLTPGSGTTIRYDY